jgi:alcohol dehydrogenase class IV
VSEASPDCLVSLGGGSTTGLSKALALRTGLPQVAIPTTYAGSEATPILGQTEQGRKTTLRSPRVLPSVILYDVELTLGMPARLSVVSGMNAMAHAVEALYAQDGNPVTSMLAEQGIAALARALPLIVADTRHIEARSDALFGAWACGNCLGTVGMSLHHKLCHTLGGSFDLPHAETHTVVLPHAAAFNQDAAPQALKRVAQALGANAAGPGLFDLAESLGAPTSLKEIGMSESDLDRAAEIASSAPYWNPRPVNRDAVRALLDDAYYGRRPLS